ncbi:hypothetical protein X975_14799, partial [Stegodyphus mimosarum]
MYRPLAILSTWIMQSCHILLLVHVLCLFSFDLRVVITYIPCLLFTPFVASLLVYCACLLHELLGL